MRDSGKLSAENVATLRHHGFDWDPHCRSMESPSTLPLSTLRVKLLDATEKRDLPQAPTTEERDLPQAPTTEERDLPQAPATEERDLPQAPATEERDLPQAPATEERDLPQAPATEERDLPQASVALGELGALHVNQDLELAIQDMEDRASRLRDLIEQEEIMSEEYRRMSEESREHLLGARDQVASFLDEVHTSLVELERLRTTACLKAMTASSPSSTESQVEEVDYEAMLDALEEDLKVVHTVPLVQVKDALGRWVEAIKKEVQMLFQTGTLRRVTHGEIKELEQSGKVLMAPAKCVFTLKPPSISGRRARRKCRIVICGNYVPAGSSDISLYASGASTDALRVALVLSSLNNWLGAVSDIASAFLLAPWPKDLPRYAIRPPKVVRDSGEATDSEYWVIDRALYGLRESPAIWGSFRSKRLSEARISFDGVILRFVATISDPELWLVQEERTKELYGLLVTYVDDLLYFGKRT